MTELVVLDVWPQRSSPVVLPGSPFIDPHLEEEEEPNLSPRPKTKPASCMYREGILFSHVYKLHVYIILTIVRSYT